MKMKKITAKEAQRITRRLGQSLVDDGLTYYATNEEETGVWTFDSKKERDQAVSNND